MFDTEREVSGAGTPGVRVYEDDEKDNAFYVLAASPRLLFVDGRPQIDLMIHGTGTGSEFVPTGGFFNCTTTGAATDEQLRLAQESLGEFLGASGRPPNPAITLLSPDWRAGKATLQLMPELQLIGQPSLTGGNACVFHHVFSGAGALELESLWRNGSYEPEVVYELTATARGKPGGTRLAFRGSLILADFRFEYCVRRVSLG